MNKNMHTPRPLSHAALRSCSGQALVELMVGLVVVMVLISALLHIAAMCSAHTDAMIDARKDVAELCMTDLPPGMELLSNPDYIRDWDEGADRRRLSRDDEHDDGNAANFQALVVDSSVQDASGWDIIDQAPYNNLSRLRADPFAVNSFGLVKGTSSKSLQLDANGDMRGFPAFRKLVYKSDTIDVEATAWMTLCKGIY